MQLNGSRGLRGLCNASDWKTKTGPTVSPAGAHGLRAVFSAPARGHVASLFHRRLWPEGAAPAQGRPEVRHRPGPCGTLTAAAGGWACCSGSCGSAGPACSREARPGAPATGTRWMWGGWRKDGWAQAGPPHPRHGPAPTSVMTLRTPRIRSEVWKRPGLVLTASRTRPTKSRSWRGSAHRGPPSYRYTAARWEGSRQPQPQCPPCFPCPASPGVAARSVHTRGRRGDRRLQRT